ncbi:unnamed protein product, partial [marine sediment metagenome]
KGIDEGWRDAGMSCADFHLPESSKVTIMSGSQFDVGDKGIADGMDDAHYCTRLIRVTVKRPV